MSALGKNKARTTDLVPAAINNAPDIIQDFDRSDRRDEREEMLYESKSIFLLLSRCVNIGEEQWNVVTTDESHFSTKDKISSSPKKKKRICNMPMVYSDKKMPMVLNGLLMYFLNLYINLFTYQSQ